VCGRFASSRSAADLAVYFEVEAPSADAVPPSWNVAPTDPVLTVAVRREGHRVLQVARWGLVPSWATTTRGAARLINARRETIVAKPAFRAAYARRRCLVPADGYYEWKLDGDRKQPWFLSSPDALPLAMAGLYELRRDEAGQWQVTCAVVTTSAPDDLGEIHDRAPLLVPRQSWTRWLDPALADPGSEALVAGTPGVLAAWPVSAAVGNVRNDGPELVAPQRG